VHELSICQALLSQVTDIAVGYRTAGLAQATVDKITIEIGPLSGVDPSLLRSAFDVMRARGCAAAAELVIEPVVVQVECVACGTISAAAANRLICAQCGGYRTSIVSGQELRLLRVEMHLN
jgi:hydrogenase nickel incorporation protein HypA/HybF